MRTCEQISHNYRRHAYSYAREQVEEEREKVAVSPLFIDRVLNEIRHTMFSVLLR